MKEKKLLLKHWIPFRLMLYIQSKFQLKNQSRKMLKRCLNNFFLILRLKIRLGVENHKTKFQTKTDLSLVHKVDYDERNHHFTEN